MRHLRTLLYLLHCEKAWLDGPELQNHFVAANSRHTLSMKNSQAAQLSRWQTVHGALPFAEAVQYKSCP